MKKLTAKEIATRAGITTANVEDVFYHIAKALEEGDKVYIAKFGTFEISERAERSGRNPQTGESMTIAACRSPKFKAGKALKEALN